MKSINRDCWKISMDDLEKRMVVAVYQAVQSAKDSVEVAIVDAFSEAFSEEAREMLERLLDDIELAQHHAHKAYEEYNHAAWAVSTGESRAQGLVRLSSRLSPRMYLVYALFAEYLTVLMGPKFLEVNGPVEAVAKHVAADAAHADVNLDQFLTGYEDAVNTVLGLCFKEFESFLEAVCEESGPISK